MKIAIIDCEYSGGISVSPNPWLMKISSYYKQLGYEVFLIDDVIESDRYDHIFINKETEFSPTPNPEILFDENVYLMGDSFRSADNLYEIPLVVHMARPDYSLYTYEFESDDTKASYLSITYRGKIYETQNQERNFRENPKTIVIDKGLWRSPHLSEVLDILKGYGKLEFLEPVDITFLKTEELIQKFTDLRLLNHTFKLKKVSSPEELERVIFLLNEMKKRKSVSVKQIEYISTTTTASLENLKDVIRAIAIANRNSCRLKILVPSGVKSYVSFIKYNQRDSYFDYLLKTEYYMDPEKTINNEKTQDNIYVKMIKTLSSDEETLRNGFTRWGGSLSPTIKLINKENVND